MVLERQVLDLSNLSSTRQDIGSWCDDIRIIGALQRGVSKCNLM